MSSLQDSTTTVAVPVQEPCPTPLEWRAVVGEFRRLSTTIQVAGADGQARSVTYFGAGRPLYFLGPAAGDAEQFSLIAWLLKDDFCCVFVEPPSIRWPVNGLRELQRWNDAIVVAANELQHDHFGVLGVGAGTTVGLDLALNSPGRVAALALLQASPIFTLSWLERGLYMYGGLMPGRLSALPGWQRLQQRNHRSWFPPFDHSRFEFLVENHGRTPIRQASRRTLLWAGLDFRPQLGAIQQPVLLIQTEGEGRLIDAGMQTLQTGLPHAQTESLHNVGQHACLTHPHRVAKLLRTFLETAMSPSSQPAASFREGEAPAEPHQMTRR